MNIFNIPQGRGRKKPIKNNTPNPDTSKSSTQKPSTQKPSTQKPSTQKSNKFDKKLNMIFNVDKITKEDDEYDEDEIETFVNPFLNANHPSTLNSLIAIGLYFINEKFIIAENVISDYSAYLSAHPNFMNDIKLSLVKENPFTYCTNDFIRILERKFMKYIDFTFLGDNTKPLNSDFYTERMPLAFSRKDESNELYTINPKFDYVIIPCLQGENKSNFKSFPDSFKYCFKCHTFFGKIDDSKIDDCANYIANYTMKYQLRWIISTSSDFNNEGAVSLLNNQLFIRIDKHKYLKFENNSITQVNQNNIFHESYPMYFCYEKLPLNLTKEKVKQILTDN